MMGMLLISFFKSDIPIIRYHIPDDWPYQEARQLFKEPLVYTDEEQLEIKWAAPDEEVINF